MPHSFLRAPRALFRLGAPALAAVTLLLAGCGGGSDTAPVAPPAATTVVDGVVAKGRVDGAQVCAHAWKDGHKAEPLGACVTTGADGAFHLAVPAADGQMVLLEATGGQFVDEVSGATVSLAGRAPLTSFVAADGQAHTRAVTPLTTLAVNDAAQGQVSADAYAAAVAAVVAAFGLPADFDPAGTLPDFGTADDVHAHALTVVSQMLADGLDLDTLLAGVGAADLAAAYASAEQTLAGGGGGADSGASATGSLTVTGGRVPRFDPQADGFEVRATATGMSYRFWKDVRRTEGNAILTLTQELVVDTGVDGAVRSVSYNDPQTPFDAGYLCALNCAGVTLETAAGATHPVTLRFAGTPLGAVTLQGSLTGDADDAIWRVQDLPWSTDGLVGIDGVNHAIVQAQFSVVSAGGISNTSVRMLLIDGASVSVDLMDGGAPTVAYAHGADLGLCFAGCPVVLTRSGGGLVVDFNALPLSNGMVLDNAIYIAATQGRLDSAALGGFVPLHDSVSSANDVLTHVFSNQGSNTPGVQLVSVSWRGSQVLEVSVSSDGGARLHQCFAQAAPHMGVPACQGVTLAADRRTVTFSQVALGGAQGQVTIDGRMVAQSR